MVDNCVNVVTRQGGNEQMYVCTYFCGVHEWLCVHEMWPSTVEIGIGLWAWFGYVCIETSKKTLDTKKHDLSGYLSGLCFLLWEGHILTFCLGTQFSCWCPGRIIMFLIVVVSAAGIAGSPTLESGSSFRISNTVLHQNPGISRVVEDGDQGSSG